MSNKKKRVHQEKKEISLGRREKGLQTTKGHSSKSKS